MSTIGGRGEHHGEGMGMGCAPRRGRGEGVITMGGKGGWE